MRRHLYLTFIFCGMSDLACATPADDLMTRNLAANKVSGAEFRATMRLITANGNVRERQTEGATKLQSNGHDNMRVTRFLSPADAKGTTTLLIENSNQDDDMWVYLPALKKVRRLAASNKRDSFMGTDLSFGDVIGYKVTDWQHKILGQKTIAGRACTEVESVPVSDSVRQQSGYSRRVSCIDAESDLALRVDYSDEQNKPVKTVELSDIQRVDAANNRWQGMRMTAKNLQTGHRTEIVLQGYRLNPSIEAKRFKAQALDVGL